MNSHALGRLNRAVVELTTGRRDPDVALRTAQPPDGYRLWKHFISQQECSRWLKLINERSELFKPVQAKSGMSLPYNVLDGNKVDEYIPELRSFANGPLLKAIEETFGLKLEPMTDPKRS